MLKLYSQNFGAYCSISVVAFARFLGHDIVRLEMLDHYDRVCFPRNYSFQTGEAGLHTAQMGHVQWNSGP